MELKEVIEKRRSVRKYSTRPVANEDIAEILRLAYMAPSAGALRPYRVVTTKQRLTNYDAPVHLVICALPEQSARRYGNRGRSLYAIQDATIVGAYIQLLAVDMGMATVWVGAFKEGRIKRDLDLPKDWRPIALMPIGYEWT